MKFLSFPNRLLSAALVGCLCLTTAPVSAQSDPDAEALPAKVSVTMKGYFRFTRNTSRPIDRQRDFEMEQAGVR